MGMETLFKRLPFDEKVLRRDDVEHAWLPLLRHALKTADDR